MLKWTEGLLILKISFMNTNRRHFIITSVLGSAALMTSASCKHTNSQIKITILHTNDVHSHIEPFPINHSKFPGQGGYARRAVLIKQIRREEEHVLLLDSGDIFQGTPYFNFYKGELDIRLMGDMDYDASTLGNHEFDNGIEELSKQMSKAKFPFINSNYDLKHTPLAALTHPYKIIEKGPVTIGIIGLGIELNGLVDPNRYGEFKCLDPVGLGDVLAGQLKKEQKCDFVIALSHIGYDYKTQQVSDIILAKNTSNIDLILGGHTHTFLDQPTVVSNKQKKQVVINQTGWGGINLGRLDFIFDTQNQNSQLASHALV